MYLAISMSAMLLGVTIPLEGDAELELGLQVRPRLEKVFSGNIGAVPGNPNFRITQRSRGELQASWRGVTARVSFQDVRTWAEEARTTFNLDGSSVGIYEGWAQIEWNDFTLRVGRQAIGLDSERLIGKQDWAQAGRSFDGARLGYFPTSGLGIETMYARIADGGHHDMAILYPWLEALGARFAAPLILQTNAGVPGRQRGSRPDDWTRFTGGVHISAQGDLHWGLEGYLQGANNTFAHMVGGRVGYRFNRYLDPEVWVDYLSGDSNHADNRNEAFDTLFGTNHKFYGFIDRFLNIPVDTQRGGLIDLALKQTGAVGGGELHAAVHLFITPNPDTLGRSGPRGVEVDVMYTWNVHEMLAVQLGEAIFVDVGDYASGRRTVRDWFYLQLTASL